MKIVAIADLHGYLPEIPPADVFLLAGDICPVRDHSLKRQAKWVWDEFRPWLMSVPAKYKFGIAGNHDFIAQEDPSLMYDLPWEYLQDEPFQFEDEVVYGTPWVPTFGQWAFMDDEDKLVDKWKKIPDTTTILLSHGPMAGYGGFTARDVDAGSTTMRDRVENLKHLRFHAFGHIHEAYGDYERHLETGLVLHSNVSFVDLHYRPRPLANLRSFEF
jgi:calcineurin-like phosphoesterase family protein